VAGRGIADEENPAFEVKDRRSNTREDIPTAQILEHLQSLTS
jgi:hypothetical protein